MITVTMLALTFMSVSAGKKVGGAQIPDSLAAGGEQLALNGAGLRKKFVVKVYAGALFLKNKSGDAKTIINADESMAIRMHFLYGVKPDQLTDAFDEGFEAAGADKNNADIKAFKAMFDTKTKKGDTYDIIYVPGKGIEVLFNGQSKGTVSGLDIKKAVFAIWLGDKISDGNLKSLRKAMLGK